MHILIFVKLFFILMYCTFFVVANKYLLTYLILYLENCAIILLPIGHILGGFVISLCLAMESKTLASFHGKAESVWICCTYQWPKSPRKIICHEFWRNRFVYFQTHLLMQAIATANKQLLSVVM